MPEFNHNTEDCTKNTKDKGGNKGNEDGLDVMDGLEEGKPTVDGVKGMA